MVRLKQALIVLAGAALAAVMAVLGVWQLDVYHAQGARRAAERAAQAPVALTSVAPAGTAVTDGYGRSVSFDGTYDAALALLVPVEGTVGQFRVVTAFRQSDGSVVPVVRGLTTSRTVPDPPAGPVRQVGVLLPSEEDQRGAVDAPGQLSTIRIPVLAQRWPGPLVSGFVTLAPDESARQHLTPVTLALPSASGRLRNGAYALQWWVFAAFAVILAVRMARDYGRGQLVSVHDAATAEPT